MMIPFLVFSLAAIGLNILTGYTGLLSLGSAGFMGVGAYACYKLETYFPQVNILVWILASGLVSSAVGVVFGLPSLRIKGFYLAVATLAAQFFLEWCFARVPWLVQLQRLRRDRGGDAHAVRLAVTGPTATPVTRYYVALAIVAVMAWIASNIVHGRIGRMWMAVRDMDIAAELIGIRLLRAKLLAFAVSSFYIGVAGAMMVFLWLGAAEPEAFNIDLSFQLLVHGRDRRLGLDRRGVLRRDDHPSAAHRPARPAGDLRPRHRLCDDRSFDLHRHRRFDHHIPNRRAARSRPALADGQAKAARLAVPLLERAT